MSDPIDKVNLAEKLLAASLDEEPADTPVMPVNVASKAPWYRILDDLPQHEGLPPQAAALLGG